MFNSKSCLWISLWVLTALLTGVTHAEQATTDPATDTTDPYALVAEFDPAQRQLLKLNAMKLLNTTAGQVRSVAEFRQQMIDDYLNEKDMMSAFRAAGPHELAQIPARNWDEEAAEGKMIPVTFQEAMELAINAEIENGGINEVLEQDNLDINNIETHLKATETMAKTAFASVIKTMADVEAKAAFIKEQNELDDLIAWADVKMAEEDAKAAETKAAQLEANRVRAAAEKQSRQEKLMAINEERKIRDAEREARQQAALEQAWNRQVQAYELQTERIRAKRTSSGRYYRWDDRYWYRKYRR